jgi:hypothetical protein
MRLQCDGTLVGDRFCCFVQRVTSGTTGQVVSVFAGPTADGTTVAVNHLLRERRQLAKRYPDSRLFCHVLRLTSAEQYVVIHRFPEPRGSG